MKIAVLDDFQDAARGMADWSALDVSVFTDNVTGAALVERLRPFDVAVLIRERSRFPRSLLEQLPNLRMIATLGMRNAAIDMDACRERGIVVTGTEGGGAPTAELAFGLILALSRNIVAEDRSLRAGTWQTRHIGSVVHGKTLGLVGLGKLGAEVARMGQAFGMDCLAWSPNLTPERAQQAGCRAVDKATLFGSSDYISLHLVLSERSRGIVGAADIAAMRPTACLVNTSRAGLLDEVALIEALEAGRIGGAGLDVFAEEPLPAGAPILSAPNTILTPHLGYATRENYANYFPQVVECIQGLQSGKVIRPLQ
jgi:phosphoglycerate dehydrogenase-like enzyme